MDSYSRGDCYKVALTGEGCLLGMVSIEENAVIDHIFSDIFMDHRTSKLVRVID